MVINSDHTVEETSGLDELIESHTKRLSELLSRAHTLDEVIAEVRPLNDLLEPYTRRDDLPEKLLNITTPEQEREQILETLSVLHQKLADNRIEIYRLRERSHMLIEKSSTLLARAQQEIGKLAHRNSGYTLEPCGLCRGRGGSSENPCPACNGKAKLLIRQPALKCARCEGEGTASDADLAVFLTSVCMACGGTGWVMSIDQLGSAQ